MESSGGCRQEQGRRATGRRGDEGTGGGPRAVAASPWALCSPPCSKHQAKCGAAVWGLLDRPSPDPQGAVGTAQCSEPDPRLQLRLDGFLPLILSAFILCTRRLGTVLHPELTD